MRGERDPWNKLLERSKYPMSEETLGRGLEKLFEPR
jgi:hypothetical protein